MRRTNQRRDAVFACYQQEVTDRPLSVLLADAKPFTVELANGVDARKDELDSVIAEFAQGWSLNRIAPLEKNIMRVAIYEMEYRDDVPYEVAIDEAVETAKKFCGAEAPGFVNGILGAIARKAGVEPKPLIEDEIDETLEPIELSELPGPGGIPGPVNPSDNGEAA